MGKVVYEAPKPHICDTPDKDLHYGGTIWKCDCGRFFKLVWGLFSQEFYWSQEAITRRERKKYRNG